MANSDDAFRINTPGILAPGTASGYLPVLITDIIEPQYPAGNELGATLTIFRPGELAPVVMNIPIPYGSILCYIEPETAAKMRPQINAAVRRQREQLQREQAARGEMGRRS